MKKSPLYIAVLLLVGSLRVSAQTTSNLPAEGAIRDLQNFAQRQLKTPAVSTSLGGRDMASELYPGESADAGPQYLAVPREKRSWWEASADVQYFYTSNMFLTERHPTDTGVLITTAQAVFAPPAFDLASGQVAVRAGYRHQRYMYGLDDTENQLNNVDFDVATFFASARHAFGENWAASVGLDYNRLLSHEENWNEFYTELLPTWGLERQIPLGERHTISLAYTGATHFTHTDPDPVNEINDRTDSIISLTWSWQFVRGVIAQPYYRFQHTHYWENSDRNDLFHTAGASVGWLINDWASVRAFANWERRDSSDPQAEDYVKFDAGGGVSIAVRF